MKTIDDIELQSRIDLIANSDSTVFSEIVHLAGIDVGKGLIGGNFQGADFTGSDLRSFNFSGADLRGVKWSDALVDKSTVLKGTMNGRIFTPFDTTDTDSLYELIFSSKTWAERFLAFAMYVDIFGETDELYGIAADVVGGEKSTYSKICCSVYLAASYVRNNEAMKYCKVMAEDTNSPNNWGRVQKAFRLSREISADMTRLPPFERFPNEIAIERIQNILDRANRRGRKTTTQ